MNTQNIKMEKVLVTPALANQLLEANVNNRPVRKVTVLRYSKDMSEGKWKEDTFEAIKIAPSGLVLDGQHRLLAVIKSNTSVYMHIAYGVPENVFDVLDTGKVRNPSDIFYISGVPSSNTIPSMIQNYNSLKDGSQSAKYHHNLKLSNSQLLEKYYEREDFWRATALKATNWYNAFAKILPPSKIGSMYAFFYDIDANDAHDFMAQLCTGLDIKNNSIALLRQVLMKDKMSHKNSLAPSTVNAYIIKTWNFYRKNATVKYIKYVPEQESFPKPL